MWSGAHQSESSGSGSKDGSPKDFADEVLLTIEEHREKRRADKGARATFLLNQFDEGKLMVLNAMGLKYVVDAEMLEAHDQACEDRKGGKGATDQTYYDKNGVVIWRSKADQAAHMAQKQQQRKP